MANKLKELSVKAKESLKEFSEHKDTKAAAKWTKETSIEVGERAKKFSKTELGKQMLIPAVIGAVIAIPIPVIGPIFGFLAGAAWGYYNYISKSKTLDIVSPEGAAKGSDARAVEKDLFAELAKLDVLRRSGTLSEAEFAAAKDALLKSH